MAAPSTSNSPQAMFRSYLIKSLADEWLKTAGRQSWRITNRFINLDFYFSEQRWFGYSK